MFANELGKYSADAHQAIISDCDAMFDSFKEFCRQQASFGLSNAGLECSSETEFGTLKILNEAKNKEQINAMSSAFKEVMNQKMRLCGFQRHYVTINKKHKSKKYVAYISSSWKKEQAPTPESNLILNCSICLEDKPIRAIQPCGHLSCNDCIQKQRCVAKKDTCPFCRCRMDTCIPLYQS